jgi:hypothetical protein
MKIFYEKVWISSQKQNLLKMFCELSLTAVRCLSLTFAAICCILNVYSFDPKLLSDFSSFNAVFQSKAVNDVIKSAQRLTASGVVIARYYDFLRAHKVKRKKSRTRRAIFSYEQQLIDTANKELFKYFDSFYSLTEEIFRVFKIVLSVVINIASFGLVILGKLLFKLGFIMILLVPFFSLGSIFKMNDIPNISKKSVQLQNGFLPPNYSLVPLSRVHVVRTKDSTSEYMSNHIPDR